MHTFSEVIRAWPNRSAMAADLRVDYGLVKQWERRDSIPAAYWPALVERASDRSISGVTLEMLARLAERKLTPSAAQPEAAA